MNSKVSTEIMLTCPYNKNHVVSNERFNMHLTKCSRNHPNVKLKVCAGDSMLRMTPSDYRKHLVSCMQCDRREVSKQNTPGSQEEFARSKARLSPEFWDDMDHPTYNPAKTNESKIIIRASPSTLTKTEKKMFRKKEDHRLMKLIKETKKEKMVKEQNDETCNVQEIAASAGGYDPDEVYLSDGSADDMVYAIGDRQPPHGRHPDDSWEIQPGRFNIKSVEGSADEVRLNHIGPATQQKGNLQQGNPSELSPEAASHKLDQSNPSEDSGDERTVLLPPWAATASDKVVEYLTMAKLYGAGRGRPKPGTPMYRPEPALVRFGYPQLGEARSASEACGGGRGVFRRHQ